MSDKDKEFVDKHFPVPAETERPLIDEETYSAGMGPLSLDVKMLLQKGFTLAEANALWAELTAVWLKFRSAS